MGLQMKGARIGRRGEEIDRARVARVAHIDDGKAVAEHVADIGVALVHHDLHAVAVAVSSWLLTKSMLRAEIGVMAGSLQARLSSSDKHGDAPGRQRPVVIARVVADDSSLDGGQRL